MALVLVSPPAIEPISLSEAKAQLRVEAPDEDQLIQSLISAARQHLDGRAGLLGRALITQTWDLGLDGFPSLIEVPLPPLQSVMSITYVDSGGESHGLPESEYQVDAGSEPARVMAASGRSWPSTRTQLNAVTVRFVAGYGDNPADVPQPLRQAILLLTTHWYEQRGIVSIKDSVHPIGTTFDALITNYRMGPFG